MSDELPERPMLAGHALARRHLVGDAEHVVLHDLRTSGLVVLGAREWNLLSCADGTRDLVGILRAGARVGAHAKLETLRAFLEQLHAAGLVVDGGARDDAGPEDTEETPPELPLEVLADFSLRCDGSGSCCRIYPTIVLSPLEVARARATLPELLDAGLAPERAFLPERGLGGGTPCGWAVTLRDGRCAYLAGDGRCSLHAAAGADAKPLGCKLFPASFVDDGQRLRVSVAAECACVLASVGRGDGEPIVPRSWRTRADLPDGVWIRRLPAQVRATRGREVSRAEMVAWSRRALDAAVGDDLDGADTFWRLASELDGTGRALDRGALAPWLAALAARAERRSVEDASWRSEADLARRSVRSIARAARALVDIEPPQPTDAERRIEAFHVRSVIHGHLAVGRAPLADALRDRAVRVVVARAMARASAGDGDPAERWPLALVEAVLRGHGLSAYAADVAM